MSIPASTHCHNNNNKKEPQSINLSIHQSIHTANQSHPHRVTSFLQDITDLRARGSDASYSVSKVSIKWQLHTLHCDYSRVRASACSHLSDAVRDGPGEKDPRHDLEASQDDGGRHDPWKKSCCD